MGVVESTANQVFGGKAGERLRGTLASEAERAARVETQLAESTGGAAIGPLTAERRRLRPQGEMLGVLDEFEAGKAAIARAEPLRAAERSAS